MTNQLTVRIDVENGIAVVSRYAAVRGRTLAVAAVAGSQVLAFTAAATHVPGHEVNENIATPIVYPELIYGVVVGLVVGVVTGVVTGIATSVAVMRVSFANSKKQ